MIARPQVAVAALLATWACVGCTSNTTQPSSSLTASVAAPVGVSPANTSKISYGGQPVILTVQNAVATRPNGTVYSFEVATDPGFSSRIQTPNNVAEGANGQTNVSLATLAGSTDYYWHARATTGGTTSPFGATLKFSIGPPVILSPPMPIGPLSGVQTGPRPTFRVMNATRSGPAGPITYRFQVSTNAAFTGVFVTAIQPEGQNETGFTPTSDLPLNTTLYWNVIAIDAASGVTSAPSTVQSFTALNPSQAQLVANQLGVPLWPGVQPPGTPGHATMGSFWSVEYLTSYNGVTFLNPPLDALQVFDMLDRGMDPQSAINWMNSNGYPTQAAYYPAVQVIGFSYEYMALVNGAWSLVLKVGA